MVLADYYASGVWLEKRTQLLNHVMILHEDLALPAELAASFDLWIHDFGNHREWTASDVEDFNVDGRRLARRLKGHVKSAYEVVYRPCRWPSGVGDDEVVDAV